MKFQIIFIRPLSSRKHEEADEVALLEEWQGQCMVVWVPSFQEAVDEEEEALGACVVGEVEEII